jgi:hypothetical protein
MYAPSHTRIRAVVNVEGTHLSHPDIEQSSMRMSTSFLTVVTGLAGYGHARLPPSGSLPHTPAVQRRGHVLQDCWVACALHRIDMSDF